MTVKELIERLQTFNPELPALVFALDRYEFPEVELREEYMNVWVGGEQGWTELKKAVLVF